jgi:sugar-specific transcriptional regulator TrmB
MGDLGMYLREMGLSEYESAAYLGLLPEGRATAKEVANASDIPQSRVYDVLSGLATKGFVKQQPGRPKKFGAVNPGRAVEQYGRYRRSQFAAELDDVRETGAAFVDAVETSRLPEESGAEPDVVWSYHSERRLFDVFERLCRAAAAEIRMVTRADSIERKMSRLNDVLDDRSQAGVRLRVLVAAGDRIDDVVADRLGQCAEVRYGTPIGGQIYLFDQDAALLAFPRDGQYVGTTVHSSHLGTTLSHLFDVAWDAVE